MFRAELGKPQRKNSEEKSVGLHMFRQGTWSASKNNSEGKSVGRYIFRVELGRPYRIIQRENLGTVTCLEWNLLGLFRITQRENLCAVTCLEWNLVGLIE